MGYVKAVGLNSDIRVLKTLPVTPVTLATDGTTTLVDATSMALRLESVLFATATGGSKEARVRTHMIIFRIPISSLFLNSDDMRSRWKRTHVEGLSSSLS
jgi:hypothetical protein